MAPPFHLAFAVDDLAEARAFYGGLLGCREGRSSERWVDFDFHGHQIVAHLCAAGVSPAPKNDVDGHAVPVRHFGLVLPWAEFERLEQRLRGLGTPFLVEPHVRFPGEPGEQATLFIEDPAGNALEFKALRNPAHLFEK